jgi:hypothetical protein
VSDALLIHEVPVCEDASTVSPERIGEIAVLATWSGGCRVFESSNAAGVTSR